ncbi:MAG TPA: hypothetical protein VGC97_20600 [Pyrinomonadaceae bacterium]|jgi:hypothetical protein
MNFKLTAFILLALFSPLLLAGCTKVESKAPEEVVIDGKQPSDEIVINNSDLKKEEQLITISKKAEQLPKRTLGDKSEVETLVDGFGNKTERRSFAGHSRLRFVILQTSADGVQEVTVYGYGGEIKVVQGLGDNALTASADEIANTAQLSKTRSETGSINFLKGRRSETQSAPLQPLPSSSFQKPNAQVYQPVQPAAPQTNGDTSTAPQTKPEED